MALTVRRGCGSTEENAMHMNLKCFSSIIQLVQRKMYYLATAGIIWLQRCLFTKVVEISTSPLLTITKASMLLVQTCWPHLVMWLYEHWIVLSYTIRRWCGPPCAYIYLANLASHVPYTEPLQRISTNVFNRQGYNDLKAHTHASIFMCKHFHYILDIELNFGRAINDAIDNG